jgi:endoglucanase
LYQHYSTKEGKYFEMMYKSHKFKKYPDKKRQHPIDWKKYRTNMINKSTNRKKHVKNRKMGNIKVCLIFPIIVIVLISWRNPENRAIRTDQAKSDTTKAFKRNQNIGRGINFGNALEAPNEGEWGLSIKESYVQAIADAGFRSVRLPICWSAHMGSNYPYSIDASFLKRVDEVMNWCLDRKLAVVITIHHFNDLYNYPDNPVYLNMFFAIWKQLTSHYLSTDHERLFFEVLNEPEVNLTFTKWNQLLPKIIDSIRVSDTDRTLIIDGPEYAYHQSLSKLSIPQTEQNVIVSTRYYLPYQFAQQGAWWSTWTDLNQFLGTTWSGTDNEKNEVLADMSIIENWSKDHKRPVTIGEWGSIMFADNQSRLTWTNYVRTQFENKQFSWSYFDFGVVFKAYSIVEDKWLYGFVEALTGNSTNISDGRTSDSIQIRPTKPSKNDSLLVTSYIKIPNYCSKSDSVRISVNGSTIRIKSYHTENVPQITDTNSCADSVRLGKLPPGNYTILFNSEYIDVLNTLRYSIKDTIQIQIVNSTGISDDQSNTVKIYPIPAKEFLILDKQLVNSYFIIYDLNGILQFEGRIEDGRIDISRLKLGAYVLEVRKKNHTIALKKMMIVQ